MHGWKGERGRETVAGGEGPEKEKKQVREGYSVYMEARGGGETLLKEQYGAANGREAAGRGGGEETGRRKARNGRGGKERKGNKKIRRKNGKREKGKKGRRRRKENENDCRKGKGKEKMA